MFDLDSWQEIWHTITRNKVRSFMTAFGVFWGIFMLVVMTGAGNGLGNGTSKNVKDFAANSLFIFSNRTSMPYKGFKKGRYWNMQDDDIAAIKSTFPEVRYISGILFGGSSDNNVVRGTKYGTFNTMGYHPDYAKIDPQILIYGRFINDIDIREKRKVCVIGEKPLNDLYKPGEDPTGSLIKINGLYYTVIGASKSAAQGINMGGSADERISIPFSTLQQALHQGNRTHSIAVTAYDNVPITDIEKEIYGLVKSRHQIAPDDPQAVDGFNISEIFKTFQGLYTGIAILIWIVGMGTLLAGVVGVSNIMLVTIKERTQEIGIRRALGAKPWQIITQIMCESLVITSIAGVAGICLGVGLLGAVDSVLSANPSDDMYFENPQISFNVALLSLAILIICGMIAGLLPSYRAMQIKPIDALRDE
ncbi:MAG: ABC transporter permease [Bacteroidales bacterium]